MRAMIIGFVIALPLLLTPATSDARGPRFGQQQGQASRQAQQCPRDASQVQTRQRLRDGSCGQTQCQRWNNQNGRRQGFGGGWRQGQGRGRWQGR